MPSSWSMDWILLFLFSCPASIVFPYWACKNPLALLGSRGSAFVFPSPRTRKTQKTEIISLAYCVAGAYSRRISIRFVKKIEMCDLRRFTQCGEKARGNRKSRGPWPAGAEHPKFPLPCSKFPVLTLVTIKLTAATRVEEGWWVVFGVA